jgi:hypothetical protein
MLWYSGMNSVAWNLPGRVQRFPSSPFGIRRASRIQDFEFRVAHFAVRLQLLLRFVLVVVLVLEKLSNSA